MMTPVPTELPEQLPAHEIVRHLTHELRQPLSALESIAFHLQMTIGDRSPAVHEQVARLQQMVENANWVLSDMLHLLQMAPPSPVEIDAAELGAEVLAESWAGTELEIRHNFDDELPLLWADPEQLRHVMHSVFNLLRRTAAEPRAVDVRTFQDGGEARMEFRSLAPSVCAKTLFHPLEPNQLMTCRQIAERNGGRFDVQQDEQGWLCLTLTLPFAPQADDDQTEE